jgi:trans-aconitate methyltransferase
VDGVAPAALVPDNRAMSTVFGEDARLYDRARLDYRPAVADLVLAYAGSLPARAAEVGAGTGKGTALFTGRGFPITAVEPDPRMSELLRARFPEITVVTARFEDWTPPAGGVGLLYAVMSWHWVDPARRVAGAAAALAPGGTLALIARHQEHHDTALEAEIDEVLRRYGPYTPGRPPLPEWAAPELAAAPAFTEVVTEQIGDEIEMTTGAYLDQLRTLSPFRRRTPGDQQRVLDELRTRIDAHGGRLQLRAVTSVVLARRAPA